jgi:hypothetical protein
MELVESLDGGGAGDWSEIERNVTDWDFSVGTLTGRGKFL